MRLYMEIPATSVVFEHLGRRRCGSIQKEYMKLSHVTSVVFEHLGRRGCGNILDVFRRIVQTHVNSVTTQ